MLAPICAASGKVGKPVPRKGLQTPVVWQRVPFTNIPHQLLLDYSSKSYRHPLTIMLSSLSPTNMPSHFLSSQQHPLVMLSIHHPHVKTTHRHAHFPNPCTHPLTISPPSPHHIPLQRPSTVSPINMLLSTPLLFTHQRPSPTSPHQHPLTIIPRLTTHHCSPATSLTNVPPPMSP
jgi:hypothetical protein